MRTDGVHVRVRELESIDFSFKLGKLMKNAIFQQKTTFHHLSEQISTFIHRKAKLTFGKKHGSYRSHHSCRKAESIVFARWRQYALFTYRNKYHYLTTLYLRCSCFIIYIARNIDETFTYYSVGITIPNFNFLVIIFFRKI